MTSCELGGKRGTTALDAVDPSLLESAAVEHNPERLYSNKELAGTIEMLTDKLPPKQKIILYSGTLKDSACAR